MALQPGRMVVVTRSPALGMDLFVEWIVDCVQRVSNWEDTISTSPAAFSASIVEVTPALLASQLLSHTQAEKYQMRRLQWSKNGKTGEISAWQLARS